MYQYSNSLIRQFPSQVTGNAAVGIHATVYVGETNTLAQLFEVSGAAKSNPVTTDAKGFYSFSVADGDYRIVFSSSQFATLRISVLDGAQIREDFDALVVSNTAFRNEQQAAYDAFVLSQGWDQVGTFAAGFTYTSPNQVGQDAGGNWWRWNGAFPKVVTAGTLPSSDVNYKLVGDGVLRSDLAAGTVPIKHLDGTAALPSIAFGTDPDTGMYRKSANQIGWAVGGLEKMVLHPSGRLTLGGAGPAAMVTATLDDGGILGSAFRARANWTGSPALPYQNNDVMFLETYNNVTGDSENKSWAISSSNAYNNIPAGVVDSGTRVGVYGWAVSINVPGYTHAGTLNYQAGLMGRAGFFGSAPENQSPAGAVIRNAIGVTGQVISDSPGTVIVTGKAVEALATGYQANTVERNYAVYAQADGGISFNYSFWGEAGYHFNREKSFFGLSGELPFSESSAKAVSRMPSNSFEWGFPSAGGYGSNIGSTAQSGFPFVAFCAEYDTGNNYRTRGMQGHTIYNNLTGSLIFAALPGQSAANQEPLESFRVTSGGNAQFAQRIIIVSAAPDSATALGMPGMVAWDENYFYMCVATNTWKRTALSSW